MGAVGKRSLRVVMADRIRAGDKEEPGAVVPVPDVAVALFVPQGNLITGTNRRWR